MVQEKEEEEAAVEVVEEEEVVEEAEEAVEEAVTEHKSLPKSESKPDLFPREVIDIRLNMASKAKFEL